jgi:hypothetical protein
MVIQPAALGLRVKTGKAIAVVIQGPVHSPVVLLRRELTLTHPSEQGTFQPYHPLMDLPWEEAEAAVRPKARLIQAAADKALGDLAREITTRGFELAGAGIVGGSDQDPARIANPHIRAHAAEGHLFRQSLEAAAKTCELACRFSVEKGLYEKAAPELSCPASSLRTLVDGLGTGKVRPWRSEEKTATVAALLVLAGLSQRAQKSDQVLLIYP